MKNESEFVLMGLGLVIIMNLCHLKQIIRIIFGIKLNCLYPSAHFLWVVRIDRSESSFVLCKFQIAIIITVAKTE